MFLIFKTAKIWPTLLVTEEKLLRPQFVDVHAILAWVWSIGLLWRVRFKVHNKHFPDWKHHKSWYHDPTSTRLLRLLCRACHQVPKKSMSPAQAALSSARAIRWPHWGDQGILSGECRGRSKGGGRKAVHRCNRSHKSFCVCPVEHCSKPLRLHDYMGLLHVITIIITQFVPIYWGLSYNTAAYGYVSLLFFLTFTSRIFDFSARGRMSFMLCTGDPDFASIPARWWKLSLPGMWGSLSQRSSDKMRPRQFGQTVRSPLRWRKLQGKPTLDL
jgi:hypothetical protein